MTAKRLDTMLVEKKLFKSRSAAAKYVHSTGVNINGHYVNSPYYMVSPDDLIDIGKQSQYVSRAALKLEAANAAFKVSFKDTDVLDVGSSTGGFTDYSLKKGAKKVFAVEIGKEQMDRSLSLNPSVELHEKTDILSISALNTKDHQVAMSFIPNIVLMDLSFVSLRKILPHIKTLIDSKTVILALLKPQFEAESIQKNKGIIKNSRVRREILESFENWAKEQGFIIVNKLDSPVHGLKGNIERFYYLKLSK